ncbi:unnamed protein product [Cyprideis torosa]|uniref:Uncharacterized protein n=1 Tax=Cyprideis torosa TaxID=163714 RepID=A0A7R8WH79_9CRUS|nr:unnamed protein product [Cyprideis torosa]CAG0896266.1 unnamed protein product [Cyprideis torosa]
MDVLLGYKGMMSESEDEGGDASLRRLRQQQEIKAREEEASSKKEGSKFKTLLTTLIIPPFQDSTKSDGIRNSRVQQTPPPDVISGALVEAVMDFEDTLQRSNTLSRQLREKSSEDRKMSRGMSPPVAVTKLDFDLVSSTKRREVEYRRRASSGPDTSSVPSVSSDDEREDMSIASSTSVGQGKNGVNGQQIVQVRDQLAASLQKIKELEDEVKSLPVLKVKMSVLEEEKRRLTLELAAEKASVQKSRRTPELRDSTPTRSGAIQTAPEKPVMRNMEVTATPQMRSVAVGEVWGKSFRHVSVATDALPVPADLPSPTAKKEVMPKPCLKCIQRMSGTGRRDVALECLLDPREVVRHVEAPVPRKPVTKDKSEQTLLPLEVEVDKQIVEKVVKPITVEAAINTDAVQVRARGMMTALREGDFLSLSEHRAKMEDARAKWNKEQPDLEKTMSQKEMDLRKRMESRLREEERKVRKELEMLFAAKERELSEMNEQSRKEERRMLEHQFRRELEKRVKELEEEVERKEDIREEELKKEFKIEVERRLQEIQEEMRWNLREVAMQTIHEEPEEEEKDDQEDLKRESVQVQTSLHSSEMEDILSQVKELRSRRIPQKRTIGVETDARESSPKRASPVRASPPPRKLTHTSHSQTETVTRGHACVGTDQPQLTSIGTSTLALEALETKPKSTAAIATSSPTESKINLCDKCHADIQSFANGFAHHPTKQSEVASLSSSVCSLPPPSRIPRPASAQGATADLPPRPISPYRTTSPTGRRGGEQQSTSGGSRIPVRSPQLQRKRMGSSEGKQLTVPESPLRRPAVEPLMTRSLDRAPLLKEPVVDDTKDEEILSFEEEEARIMKEEEGDTVEEPAVTETQVQPLLGATPVVEEPVIQASTSHVLGSARTQVTPAPLKKKEVTLRLGDQKESVPNLGFGIREISYEPRSQSVRVPATLGEDDGTLPDLGHGIRKPPRKKKMENRGVPSEEMQTALKAIQAAMAKGERIPADHRALATVRKEWFQVSSTKDTDPGTLDSYLDALEEYSQDLLTMVVNLSDANGNTAMHYAVSHGNFDVVSILLDSKVVNTSAQNKAGYTCVMLVSLTGLRSDSDRLVVKRLFSLGDVNVKATGHGQTALMLAVAHGRLDMVKLLVEAGADVNIQDADGSTALMCAAEQGHLDIVKYLLKIPDCDPTLVDNDGSSALQIAMDADHKDIGVLIYATLNFSRGSSPYGSLRSARRPRAPLPQRGAMTPPACQSPTPSRKSNHSVA